MDQTVGSKPRRTWSIPPADGRLLDTSSYKNFVRMGTVTFEDLLSVIAPRITYQDTVMRQAISPGERLAVTLRFLATGLFYECIVYLHAAICSKAHNLMNGVSLQVRRLKAFNTCIESAPKQLAKLYPKHAVP